MIYRAAYTVRCCATLGKRCQHQQELTYGIEAQNTHGNSVSTLFWDRMGGVLR